MPATLRVITLEEHFHAPMIPDAAITRRFGEPPPGSRMARVFAKLNDLGEQRLADMDAGGVDVQVISHRAAVIDRLGNDRAVTLAREANDHLAGAIAAHPDRLAGFALLPTIEPRAAALELERAVSELHFKGALINGPTQGRFLDDRFFWPIFDAAMRLEVPIYLHPSEPPVAVREAYYDGLEPRVAQALATSAWGWHVDTGLHALRLVAGGVFEQFPSLQIIIGHMGEGLPFMLARASRELRSFAGLSRPLEEYMAENFHITTSGLFTYPPLLCLLETIGADRVMFSVDYPFSDIAEGREFIAGAPISTIDREKIAHANAERLLGL